MKHEKLRDTISDAMYALALEFAMTGRRDIDVADHVDALTTAILEQLEPEGEDCNCDSDHICGICWERKGFRFINGELTPPPQQPSEGEIYELICDNIEARNIRDEIIVELLGVDLAAKAIKELLNR